MTDDKPIHVRVAEALGWTWKLGQPPATCRFLCPPGPLPFTVTATNLVVPNDYRDAPLDAPICNDSYRYVPRYDTDWSATGPLIEKYGIELSVLLPGDLGKDGFRWLAAAAADAKSPNPTAYNRFADEPTPLEAICSLLLQLHKAGKL